jgi:hypothetical protein
MQYYQKTMFLILMLLTQVVFFWAIYVFLQLNWIGFFGANRAYLHLETPKFQEVFLSKLIQFSQGNNVIDAPASNADSCLWRDTCFLELSWIGLFGANTVYPHLEIPKFQEVFISKTLLILTWKQWSRCGRIEHRWFSLEKYMLFFNSAE